MTLFRCLHRWLAGPARRRELARLRRLRLARALPAMIAAATRALVACEADIDRAKPGKERWRLKCERMDWERHISHMMALARDLGVPT